MDKENKVRVTGFDKDGKPITETLDIPEDGTKVVTVNQFYNKPDEPQELRDKTMEQYQWDVIKINYCPKHKMHWITDCPQCVHDSYDPLIEQAKNEERERIIAMMNMRNVGGEYPEWAISHKQYLSLRAVPNDTEGKE